MSSSHSHFFTFRIRKGFETHLLASCFDVGFLRPFHLDSAIEAVESLVLRLLLLEVLLTVCFVFRVLAFESCLLLMPVGSFGSLWRENSARHTKVSLLIVELSLLHLGSSVLVCLDFKSSASGDLS